jgi:hypothetical protein
MAGRSEHGQTEWLGDRILAVIPVSNAAWAVLIVLAAADIFLTVIGVQSCLTEQNPVAAWALRVSGPAGLVVLKGVALGVLAVTVWYLPDRYKRAAFGGFGITQLYAVSSNAILVSSRASICG